MISPDIALLICRFIFDGSVLFLWGAALYLCTLVPASLRWQIWHKLRTFRVATCACAGVTLIFSLPVHTAIIGNGWQDATDFSMLYSVVMDTTIGLAWRCQIIGTGMLIGVALVPRSARIVGTAIVSAFLLVSLTLTGHAVMNEGPTGVLHQVNDLIHVLSAGAWLGALPVVLLLLSTWEQPASAAQVRTALIRFSTAGHVVVLLVLFTGIINTWLILDGPPVNWAYPYQLFLSLKIFSVFVMVVLATVNRYVIVPRMRRHSRPRLFNCVTTAEIILSLMVVALVAWLGTLQPN